MLIHPFFSFAMITTIIFNCFVIIQHQTEYTSSVDIIFTIIYTFEFVTKIIGQGFVLEKFTYLRDPWNWLDFVLNIFSYINIFFSIQYFPSLRSLRLFRPLNSINIGGVRYLASSIVYATLNLRDVLILTFFILAIFSLIGTQLFMGTLSQKCIQQFPTNLSDVEMWGALSDSSWELFMKNTSHWLVDEDGLYVLCGNITGTGTCPDGFLCLAGYGSNPDYGQVSISAINVVTNTFFFRFTSFDNFFQSYLCVFRIMTQDFWDNLYKVWVEKICQSFVISFRCCYALQVRVILYSSLVSFLLDLSTFSMLF